jgi:diacylglycerol kinase (ATP)
MNLVAPGFYIARFPFPSESGTLRDGGVDAINNLCWEFPRDVAAERITGAEIAYVPILDGTAPTPEQFDDAVRAAAQWRAAGRCVLIHCAQGRGRSATIAAAVLVRLNYAADVEQALSMIRAARPLARPSRQQKRALMAYLSSERSVLRGVRWPRGATDCP